MMVCGFETLGIVEPAGDAYRGPPDGAEGVAGYGRFPLLRSEVAQGWRGRRNFSAAQSGALPGRHRLHGRRWKLRRVSEPGRLR